MPMSFFLRNCLGWGAALWLFGYVLGFVFFAFVPADQIGWYITPFGILATAFVLWRYVRVTWLPQALAVGLVWTILAVVLDYLFLVLLLNPADGYYKLDVYLYYALTFLMPPASALIRKAFGAGQNA